MVDIASACCISFRSKGVDPEAIRLDSDVGACPTPRLPYAQREDCFVAFIFTLRNGI
jgi:hypothetical protein